MKKKRQAEKSCCRIWLVLISVCWAFFLLLPVACLSNIRMFVSTSDNELFVSCRTFGLQWMGMLITDKLDLWSIVVCTCRNNSSWWKSWALKTENLNLWECSLNIFFCLFTPSVNNEQKNKTGTSLLKEKKNQSRVEQSVSRDLLAQSLVWRTDEWLHRGASCRTYQ